ncbi:hypothetical protein BGW36DRAFT_16686 [Talaromyces proteolyticus]|uniref:Uncharacterized protein n=1 Tax=Talaromyces proteolyticus TaxID=1131652 RepID=A0AAD4L175_9EURO|nr:uncharacterized protein BGW36DRAFT_16686 [Talaromyces proteolyticus]KAH8705677.1 hypothetical protein BGW36DRAFT_16686 [Talaromyces proteolyticus]
MSDTEQEWKPNPRRPQSTMAQAFSLALDNAFMLDSDVDHLTQSIEQKKQMMTIQARELEALQAKIREAEERLNRDKSDEQPSSQANGRGGSSSADQEGRGSTDSAATSHDLDVGEDHGKAKETS